MTNLELKQWAVETTLRHGYYESTEELLKGADELLVWLLDEAE